ncbi:hypothetical protein AD947_08695 [Acetobacter tropicalis]|uniref:Uncharacterized protein n=1 Tax=Acetobacter tropicalis TaxID=104102 RepID=A0A149TVX9_9PROT|nr:hypothetical protein AD947_08695 [Acetobacter tropicalis]
MSLDADYFWQTQSGTIELFFGTQNIYRQTSKERTSKPHRHDRFSSSPSTGIYSKKVGKCDVSFNEKDQDLFCFPASLMLYPVVR